MCSFFQVSRSGYYAYLGRTESTTDASLVQLIRQCREETDRTYGYRRIGLWLDRRGSHANHKRIYRIMQKFGLFSEVRRKRKYQQMSDQLHRYPNLLNRDFTANRPNEKWVTDISYIGTVSFAELDVNHLLDYELSTKFGCNERSDCTIAFQQTATTSKNMPVISGSR